ncbi:hypothetical protein [Paraburkholderia caffeinilytica]|uniref:hypothetical protein n=1 Tax=Paraburkholderia caffeinilytica TaxID=1761016 RepID=UPI0013BE8DE4|nr:hypothetical protein [Paraburkholderia caffeinilytica]
MNLSALPVCDTSIDCLIEQAEPVGYVTRWLDLRWAAAGVSRYAFHLASGGPSSRPSAIRIV